MNPMAELPDEETCWQAVMTRDSRYNGALYYGVRSTGIYCKPDCPSRRPRREQVAFFASPDAAEAAGFRACRRCQPRQPLNADVQRVEQACRLMDTAPEPLTLRELSAQLGLSPYHFQRMFKAVTGTTPHQYAARQRMQQFKHQVRNGQAVSGALYEAGFNASSRLYEGAAQHLGMTPAVYRRGGKDMHIDYTVVDCYLGRMLLAATAQGVCAISFGDDDAALEMQLRAEFPAAELARAEDRLQPWVSMLLEHLAGRQPRLDLPLDVQATAFQLQVWAALREIPYGQTRTYAEVAQTIGRPRAVRAVGHACATNPAAVLTPCHRVVRSDGGLGGYRWGLERKEALLAQEQRAGEGERLAG